MGLSSKKGFALLSIASFFISLHLGLIAYIGSSFISESLGTTLVGIVYAIAAAVTLVVVFLLPRILETFGVYKSTSLLSLILFLSITGLVYARTFTPILIFFIATYVLGIVIKLLLDLYVEHASDDTHTGRIRGLYLTIGNSAWLLSPFLSGLLAERGFSQVYSISAVALVPALFIILYRLPHVSEFNIKHSSIVKTLIHLWKAERGTYKYVADALMLDFFLNLFYAVMLIYMPLLLHNTVGMAWTTIGLIFTVMLVPFVVIQYPLGWMADTSIGEKEVIIAALMIMALACLLVPFTVGALPLAWAFLLFMSRIGAASLEIMKESYLFKHIDEHDALIVSLSRNAMPASYLVAPVFATIILSFATLPTVFTILGVVLLCALVPTSKLRDTR